MTARATGWTSTLEGPIQNPEELDRITRQGDVVVDDVGVVRTRRYGNSVQDPGWWSHKGDSALSSRELTEKGTRPVWVIRLAATFPKPQLDPASCNV